MSDGLQPLLVLAGLTALAVVVYIGLFILGNAYSVRTGWNPPRGTEETDWTLRRNVAFVLGLIATVVCAIGSWLWLSNLTAQLVAVGEGVLLAAAGASDLRRFHLPLPFTIGGIAIAIAVAIASQTPLFVMLFALGWAVALILLHAVVSKGSMQLGDHIATIWIALVLPFNGMIALLAGDLANVFLARARGLKGKKVAAAGAWLIFCAALIGVPPYVTWRAQTATMTQLIVPIATYKDGCTFVERVITHECTPVAIGNPRASSVFCLSLEDARHDIFAQQFVVGHLRHTLTDVAPACTHSSRSAWCSSSPGRATPPVPQMSCRSSQT